MPKDRFEKSVEEDNIPYGKYVKQGYLTLSGNHDIDYRDVQEWLMTLIKKYKIRPLKVGYDRWSATYLIQDLKQSGLQTDDVYQGTNLSPLLDEFESRIKDKVVQIGENELLKAHLLNVAVQINSGDGRKKPVKIERRLHIDGFVSVIDAFTVRSKYYSEIGKLLKNKKSA